MSSKFRSTSDLLWGLDSYFTAMHWLIAYKGLILTLNSACYKLNISSPNHLSKFALFPVFFVWLCGYLIYLDSVSFSWTPLPRFSSSHHHLLPGLLQSFLNCFPGIYSIEFKIQTAIFLKWISDYVILLLKTLKFLYIALNKSLNFLAWHMLPFKI